MCGKCMPVNMILCWFLALHAVLISADVLNTSSENEALSSNTNTNKRTVSRIISRVYDNGPSLTHTLRRSHRLHIINNGTPLQQTGSLESTAKITDNVNVQTLKQGNKNTGPLTPVAVSMKYDAQSDGSNVSNEAFANIAKSQLMGLQDINHAQPALNIKFSAQSDGGNINNQLFGNPEMFKTTPLQPLHDKTKDPQTDGSNISKEASIGNIAARYNIFLKKNGGNKIITQTLPISSILSQPPGPIHKTASINSDGNISRELFRTKYNMYGSNNRGVTQAVHFVHPGQHETELNIDALNQILQNYNVTDLRGGNKIRKGKLIIYYDENGERSIERPEEVLIPQPPSIREMIQRIDENILQLFIKYQVPIDIYYKVIQNAIINGKMGDQRHIVHLVVALLKYGISRHPKRTDLMEDVDWIMDQTLQLPIQFNNGDIGPRQRVINSDVDLIVNGIINNPDIVNKKNAITKTIKNLIEGYTIHTPSREDVSDNNVSNELNLSLNNYKRLPISLNQKTDIETLIKQIAYITSHKRVGELLNSQEVLILNPADTVNIIQNIDTDLLKLFARYQVSTDIYNKIIRKAIANGQIADKRHIIHLIAALAKYGHSNHPERNDLMRDIDLIVQKTIPLPDLTIGNQNINLRTNKVNNDIDFIVKSILNNSNIVNESKIQMGVSKQISSEEKVYDNNVSGEINLLRGKGPLSTEKTSDKVKSLQPVSSEEIRRNEAPVTIPLDLNTSKESVNKLGLSIERLDINDNVHPQNPLKNAPVYSSNLYTLQKLINVAVTSRASSLESNMPAVWSNIPLEDYLRNYSRRRFIIYVLFPNQEDSGRSDTINEIIQILLSLSHKLGPTTNNADLSRHSILQIIQELLNNRPGNNNELLNNIINSRIDEVSSKDKLKKILLQRLDTSSLQNLKGIILEIINKNDQAISQELKDRLNPDYLRRFETESGEQYYADIPQSDGHYTMNEREIILQTDQLIKKIYRIGKALKRINVSDVVIKQVVRKVLKQGMNDITTRIVKSCTARFSKVVELGIQNALFKYVQINK